MMHLDAAQFAKATGITVQAARKAFRRGEWHGFVLPVVQAHGRGGSSGKVWGLVLDQCAPELRTTLITKPAADLPIETPVERPVHAPVEEWRFDKAVKRQRILAPVLSTAPKSRERRDVIEQASKDHGVSLPTLYRWLRSCEAKGVAALLPKKFASVGKRRVTITRAWDKGCGLSEEAQATIAAKLSATARGLIQKGRSEREVVRLCGFELRRLTENAGSPVSGMRLAEICKLNVKFAKRFRNMRIVHAFDQDHKRFTDRHEYHVKRGLTARPMQVLLGDVHTVDLTSDYKAWFIAWMDGASGYMWVTPVLTRGNQGISQRDVANSLYEVVTCPWGGMPETFLLDNGGEYGFISECVTRFAAMAELSKLSVIKCQPYHPEGKARLEGAFQIIEDRFLSHLPGYHGGNHLNPRLSGRGKPVASYDRGADQLLHDLKLAVAQYNGTPQDGDLKRLSPKAMLEQKAAQTGWQASQIDPADPIMFDLVFSDEVRRDVRQGKVSINTNLYSAPIMADLIGEKQVSVLVPWRDPNCDPILFRDGVIHRLKCTEFGVIDGAGARHRSEMTALQREEIERRRGQADQAVDVQALLSQAADLSPVQHNGSETWSFGHIDKGGFIGAPISEEDARERQDAEDRARMEEVLAFSRPERREAGGGNRQSSLDAT
ncbi:MAG TPA: transposase [Micropepsaceae bacterium]|nr:transposase [Micropepsaceae bacterium]